MTLPVFAETEPLEGLRLLGYARHEAAFLELAALHGGHFLRRQCAEYFRSIGHGSAGMLIEKALANGHANAQMYANQTPVYHLCARGLYGALGAEDNRNRRPRQPFSVKARVMALDFVLRHRGLDFLATERDKVDFFTRRADVAKSLLPTKRYRSREGNRSTDRHFVDKTPIFVSGLDASTPDVHFAFIDAGATSTCGFETYLEHYRSLLMALPQFGVVYVAARPKLFVAAQRAFERFVLRARALPLSLQSSQAGTLDDYFELRMLFESGQRQSFDRDRLIRLRDLRDRFSGGEIDSLYDRWKERFGWQTGQASAPPETQVAANRGEFSTCWLEFDYDAFGNVTAF